MFKTLVAFAIASILVICITCQDASTDFQIIKPLTDDRTYKYLKLPNSMGVLLIHDANTKISAASLQVNAGSLTEPKELPGLAHLLEHMLFAESEKYPQAGKYYQFINSNAGYTNAYTDFEATNYYFNIPSGAFEEALDIFSHFFIEPLLDPTAVEEQANIVDSEFTMRAMTDLRVLNYVLRGVARKTSDFARFTSGNVETLLTIPHQEGINITQAAQDFFNKYYSANLMELVLISNYTIPELESLANRMFGPIPNRQATEKVNDLLQLFPDAPKIVGYNPMSDNKFLNLVFTVDHSLTDFEVKPEAYIEKEIQYKGENSLYSLLINNGWVTNIGFVRYIRTQEIDIYRIYFELTELGSEHIAQIIEVTFSLISNVQKQGITDERFEEIRAIRQTEFDYGLPINPSGYYASNLADNLHFYGPENVLAGPTLVSKFDKQKIENFLNKTFNIENCLIMYGSKELPYVKNYSDPIVFDSAENKIIFNAVNERTYFYGFNYSQYKLPSEGVSVLLNEDSSIQIPLTPKNPFVSTDFSLLCPEVSSIDSSLAPKRIIRHNGFTIWHSQFAFKSTPSVEAIFDLFYPNALRDIGSQAAFYVLYQAINRRINSAASQMWEAGYAIDFSFYQERWSLSVKGFTDKLFEVCETLLAQFAEMRLSEQEFHHALEESIQDLNRHKIDQLDFRARYNIELLLKKYSFLLEDVLQRLGTLEYEEYLNQTNSLDQGFSLNGLIIGNIDEKGIQEIASIIQSIFDFNEEGGKITQVYTLLKGESVVYREWSPIDQDNNECIVNYYSLGDRTPENLVVLNIIRIMLTPYVFDNLRTKEKLGYIAHSMVESDLPYVGIEISLLGNSKEPFVMDKAIEQMLKDFDGYLADISTDVFEASKKNYKDQILEEQKYLVETANEWMYQIRFKKYQFDLGEMMIQYLSTFDKDQALEAFRKTFKGAGGRISYQIYSKTQGNESLPRDVLSQEETYDRRQEQLIDKKEYMMKFF